MSGLPESQTNDSIKEAERGRWGRREVIPTGNRVGGREARQGKGCGLADFCQPSFFVFVTLTAWWCAPVEERNQAFASFTKAPPHFRKKYYLLYIKEEVPCFTALPVFDSRLLLLTHDKLLNLVHCHIFNQSAFDSWQKIRTLRIQKLVACAFKTEEGAEQSAMDPDSCSWCDRVEFKFKLLWISVHTSPDGEALVSFLLLCDHCH